MALLSSLENISWLQSTSCWFLTRSIAIREYCIPEWQGVLQYVSIAFPSGSGLIITPLTCDGSRSLTCGSRYPEGTSPQAGSPFMSQLPRAHGDCGTGWVLPGPELVLVEVLIGVRDLSREAEKNASV